MKCKYCQNECMVLNAPLYHSNYYTDYECNNCKVPIIFSESVKTKQIVSIHFYHPINNDIYELILQLDDNTTSLYKVDQDYNSFRTAIKHFNYVLSVTPDNFENKLKTMLICM